MLVLTRRIGETIIINDNIRVTIVGVGPGRVKIGVDAPLSVRIDREEIHDRIAQEQAPAASGPHADDSLPGHDNPKLHNRIADKLPPAPVEASASAPVMAGDNLARFRRKPR